MSLQASGLLAAYYAGQTAVRHHHAVRYNGQSSRQVCRLFRRRRCVMAMWNATRLWKVPTTSADEGPIALSETAVSGLSSFPAGRGTVRSGRDGNGINATMADRGHQRLVRSACRGRPWLQIDATANRRGLVPLRDEVGTETPDVLSKV